MISGVAGAALGLLIGVASGHPSIDVVGGTPGSAARTVATAIKLPDRFVADFGKRDPGLVLTGSTATVPLGPHRAQRVVAASSVSVALTPLEQPYHLALVACAESAEREMSIRVNAEGVGTWVATTAWKMHALVVPPRILKPGVNIIELVPLPAQGEPGAIAIASLHLGPLETSARADAAGPGPGGSLIDGYYPREGEGEHAMSWSAGKRTEVSLLLSPLNAVYRLELTGAAFAPLQPLRVEARVNGRSAGSANLENMARYTFEVPAGALVEGGNVVELAYEKSVKPRDVDHKSGDSRDVAVRIQGVSVRPVTGP